MPLYEYACLKCKHRFEQIRKFSDPPLKKCVKCGGKIEKLVSAPAIAFKGSGWYVTEHGNRKPGGESSKGEPKGDTKADAKAETKTDTKAETKTDTKSEAPKESPSESKESSTGAVKKGKPKK